MVSVWCCRCCRGSRHRLAGEPGFEPGLTDPESAVLPLDDSPTGSDYSGKGFLWQGSLGDVSPSIPPKIPRLDRPHTSSRLWPVFGSTAYNPLLPWTLGIMRSLSGWGLVRQEERSRIHDVPWLKLRRTTRFWSDEECVLRRIRVLPNRVLTGAFH